MLAYLRTQSTSRAEQYFKTIGIVLILSLASLLVTACQQTAATDTTSQSATTPSTSASSQDASPSTDTPGPIQTAVPTPDTQTPIQTATPTSNVPPVILQACGRVVRNLLNTNSLMNWSAWPSADGLATSAQPDATTFDLVNTTGRRLFVGRSITLETNKTCVSSHGEWL